MPRSVSIALAARLLLVGLFAGVATAGPAGTDNDALSGPKVTDRPVDDSTIVRRDAMGRLVRPERDPAFEALDTLKLDPGTRAKADQIITKRHAAIDAVVRDNLLLINELNNARQSGDREQSRRLLQELYAKARPYLSRGTLADELRATLGEADHARLVTLTAAYHEAAVAERIGSMGEEGQSMDRAKADISERLVQLGTEVKRSFERSVQSGGRELDKLMADLALTPEQEGTIRQRIQDVYFKAQGKPDRGAVAKVFLESWQELTTEQRQRLLVILREQGQAKRRSAEPMAPIEPEPVTAGS